jgi:monoterpene epsilon-lactone hydrolase
MASPQARLLSVIVRAIRVRHWVEHQFEGASGAASLPPGNLLNGVAAVVTDELRGRAVWRLEPVGPTPGAPVVVHFHGGGYVLGAGRPHWTLLAALIARTGVTACMPDYPLAPESTAAETVAWAMDAYELAAAAAAVAERPVVLMGDSAGGGLALAVAVAARDRGLPMPAALVLLSPWLDVGMTAPDAKELDRRDPILTRRGLLAAGKAYAGAAGAADPLASPLFANLTGLPPTTVYVGTAEQLVADARRLAVRAAQIPGWRVDVRETPDMVHDWVLFGFLPEARAAIGEIGGILAAIR